MIQYVAVLTISEIYTVEYIYIWDIYIYIYVCSQPCNLGVCNFQANPLDVLWVEAVFVQSSGAHRV